MARSFHKSVDDWVGKVNSRTKAVVRSSINQLADHANKAGPSAARGGVNSKGGKLPVDTAFLRSSFVSAIGQMPSGASKPSPGASDYDWDTNALVLTLARVKPGDVVFLGWTANYARAMEDRYGFMRSAAAKWPSIVEAKVREARSRIR